jgi:LAO/AO transport system kinase
VTTVGTPSSSAGDRVPGRQRHLDVDALLEDARRGDRRAMARLLSAAERGGDDGRAAASLAYRSGAEADTVGVTGAPGSGKSTLVDRLIAVARGGGVEQVAVLAVDPTSPFSGGAILGDRVRMQGHDLDAGVFIRSMATRGHLGGLAVAVPEAIRLFAAAGMPLVIVETVGVGQVEVEVASATDTTVVVVNPKWGDAIQANKAGLMETADIFVINKADMPGAAQSRRDLEQMLDLSTPGDWRPPILETVAATGEGVDALWAEIGRHRTFLDQAGLLAVARRERLRGEFRRVLRARIEKEIDRLGSQPRFSELDDDVVEHRIDPYAAAEQLLAQLGEGGPGATH